jgi:hypothetical protein
MGCERYEAILTEAVGPALASALAAHVRECPDCARRPPAEHPLTVAMATSIEAALGVEPSAGFLARVRHSIAEERDRKSTRGRRWLPGLVAAAAVALGLALIVEAARHRRPSSVAESPLAPAPMASPGASAAAPAREGPEATPRPARAASPPSRPRPSGGDVLVEPGQAEALARLAAGLSAGPRPPSRFVVKSLDPEMPLPRLEPADLPRFEIKRLKPVDEWSSAWEAGGPAPDTNEGSDS